VRRPRDPDAVIVATDDERIARAVEAFGGNRDDEPLTSQRHRRLAESRRR
jgi:CMP-2-keto-3-deoxyoctulosonic acid synthetase